KPDFFVQNSTRYVLVARYLPNAQLDLGYGDRGFFLLPNLTSSTDPQLLIKPSSEAVIATSIPSPLHYQLTMAQLQGGDSAPADVTLNHHGTLIVQTNNLDETVSIT